MVNFYAPAVVPRIMQPLKSSLEGKALISHQSLCEHMDFTFVLGIRNSFTRLVKVADSFQPGFCVWVNLLAKV